MVKKLSIIMLAALMAFSFTGAEAKSPKKKAVPAAAPAPAAKPAAPADDKAPKPYNTVITRDAKTQKGFLVVHQVKDKYYFEIPDSMMGRDILVVGRISKAPVDNNKQKSGYPGDILGEDVIRFEYGPQNKVFLKNITYLEQATDTENMYTAVKNSSLQSIVAAFDVKTYNKDSVRNTRNAVLDLTEYIKGDRGMFSVPDEAKKRIGLGGMNAEGSYIDTLKAFPINIEVRSVRTFSRSGGGNMSTPMTYEINTSMVLLPKEPMKARLFDPRVAYFAVNYTDYDVNPQGIERRSRITRWRMEPKPEDVEKYKRGELVEPAKPIVIYIDPATPKKWVPYLIQGVNDWQVAFEAAGFKNAIYALEAPKDDPSWSLEDARHSAIVYKPSDIANASGPHIHDPRSGEIIETHINWYHNIMSLLHNWYTVQAGPLDPRARQPIYDDELMGELIRFVSSHEVGHTLGLRHNMGSSATVPVEKLRDKAWVEANGHTPSIMDYARFNYVAQPEDNVSPAGLFPRIGIYDIWSIEWGYRWLPQFATPEAEIPYSTQTILAKLKEDVRYTFGTETDPNDPRNQAEAVGDNAMLASAYGIKNLQRVMPNIIEWTKRPYEDYSAAAELYKQVAGQFGRYMGHVATYVGGIYTTPRTIEETGKTKEFVPASLQKQAMEFFNKQLFATPTWLIDKKLIEFAGVDPVNTISGIQVQVISRLLNRNTIDKLTRDEQLNGSKAYTPENMFADLKKGVWGELSTGKTPDIYRRNLQKTYVAALIRLLDKPAAPATAPASGQNMPSLGSMSSGVSDAPVIARAQLIDLNRQIKAAAASTSGITRAHYQNLAAQIDDAFDVK